MSKVWGQTNGKRTLESIRRKQRTICCYFRVKKICIGGFDIKNKIYERQYVSK